MNKEKIEFLYTTCIKIAKREKLKKFVSKRKFAYIINNYMHSYDIIEELLSSDKPEVSSHAIAITFFIHSLMDEINENKRIK